ncbi:AAA family ATPase [Aureimonas phyllosphaerae]|uniref:DNA polymerase III delta prime subunit n=1 Tax=Aureimonas phyllosphaerae TaxID=1166078 RepID=A0A7W6BSH7_9HYPH|nr:AAA family ATPase [Aureimonas phyllosphaerae]MBB3937223.1 DNA polymerase III delta prime subunit [Aureimonas phyllosphaerae]MBB3961140.1 DNA polymerase III delta prime subunit [Aureimonas phyllosphaerae]SFF49133.1 ATP-dependent Zn proteases [Aureimonas phyllosphaerae]
MIDYLSEFQFDEVPARDGGSAVDRLRPCARHVFERLSEASQVARARLAGEQTAFVVLVVHDPTWLPSARDAVESFLRNHGKGDGRHHRNMILAESTNREDLPIRSITRHLHECSVALCTEKPISAIPQPILAIADFLHTVSPMEACDMTTVLRRRFPSWYGEWPEDHAPRSLDPHWIDLVVERSSDAEVAIATLTGSDGFGSSERKAIGPTARTIVPFESIVGYGAAKDWGLCAANDMAAYGAGDLPWSEVHGGALLTGPPGTGKSMFAESLAAHIGCYFRATSFAEWQATGTGHLGDVTKKMRAIFQEAAENVPAMVFIDEIDSLPRRSSGHSHSDYWNAVVNCLLELLDGVGRKDGILIVAACNSPDGLDPALVRSGRLDRVFRIGLPDEHALRGILAAQLGPTVAREEIEPISTSLAGTVSGADASRMAREARSVARRAGRSVTSADLAAVALPAETRPAPIVWRVAVHEASHAVVAMATGQLPLSLSIVASEDMGGKVVFQPRWEARTVDDFRRVLIPILAGRAGEALILGEPSAGAGGGGDSDLAIATRYLATLDGSSGLGTSLATTDAADGQFVELQLRRIDAEARFLVLRHREKIVELAREAMTHRVLGSRALKAFAERHAFEVSTTPPSPNNRDEDELKL